MTKKITLMLGGIQGEGIVSVGDTFIRALSQAGYYAFGYRTFSSRIKGGHTNYVIDISTHKILSCDDALDILIAFDQDSIEINLSKLKNGGLLIYDDIVSVKELLSHIDSSTYTILPIPFTTIAKQHGNTIMKNTATVGFLAQLFQIPLESIANVIEKNFKRKGDEILTNNMKVLREGFEFSLTNTPIPQQYSLEPVQGIQRRASMIGNEAIGFGALMAGCRFMAAYPITPSSEVMEYLTKKFPSYHGVMVQTEDEISAITMTIGAAYGGVRSMTATSGPGLSLMMEGIGLAGMTEIPVVIADIQRGGPSTGLPTKHEQSDIDFVYYGAHGEIPMIIVSPYTVEECFYQTIWAFNLAEQYQCPVVILSDLHLGLSRQTVDALDPLMIQIDRGNLLHSGDLTEADLPFKRFEFTPDGTSPRAIPGQPFGMHHVTGIEHMEIGKPLEGSENRKKMMDKRIGKLNKLKDLDHIDLYGDLEGDLLILSVGSNYGMIQRVIESEGHPVAYGMFKMIKPMPVKQLEGLFSTYKKVLVIEGNATGQLASIIRAEVDFHGKLESLLKYDGTPFKYEEINHRIKELI